MQVHVAIALFPVFTSPNIVLSNQCSYLFSDSTDADATWNLLWIGTNDFKRYFEMHLVSNKH